MRRIAPPPAQGDATAVVGAAFEALPMAAAILDPGGRVARTNAAWESLDRAVTAILAGSVLTVGQGPHEPLRAALRAVLVGAGPAVDREVATGAPPRRHRFRAGGMAEGERRFVVVTAEPLADDADRTLSILDSLPSAILVTDAEDRVTIVNQRFRVFFPEAAEHVVHGLTFEEGLRRSIAAGNLPEAAADPEAFVAARMAQHRAADGEPVMRRTAKGVSFLVQERRLPDGGTLLVSTDVSDLSDQHDALARSEAMLRESREHLLTMADQMPGLIVYFDADLRLRFINRTGEAWHRRQRGEAIGRHITELLPSSRVAEIQDAIDDVLAGQAVHVERQIDYADGQRRTADVSYVPDRGPGGAVRGFFVFAFDVSERRRVEEQLRQAQKLEALGKLTGGIAHDFNNLLGVIVGTLDLLAGKLRRGSQTRALAEKAIGAAHRGASLTERLLTFSRRQVLHPAPLDANALLADMLALLPASLGSRIRVETRLAPDLWPCETDRGLLESAIVNLMLNARDAMPDGGRITIATANVSVRADDPDRPVTLRGGDYVRIAVGDTGAGMSPETRERAFEPFFTTKAGGRGTGLGLSMVYGFVRQSGGGVHIDSGSGQGTTVSLYLPRAGGRPAEGVAIASPLRHRPGRGEFVLVVEDDVAVREMATDSLLRLGYMPVAVPGAMEALVALASPRDWAVLFTDIVLREGGDGLRLAREVERRRPGIRVLLTTGYAETEQMDAAAAAGRLVLRKPYRIDQLDDAMARLLEAPPARG